MAGYKRGLRNVRFSPVSDHTADMPAGRSRAMSRQFRFRSIISSGGRALSLILTTRRAGLLCYRAAGTPAVSRAALAHG
jgi:hypothetical protein